MNIKKTIAISLLVLFVLSIVGQSVLANYSEPSVTYIISDNLNQIKEGTTFTIDVEIDSKTEKNLQANIKDKPQRATFKKIDNNKWQFRWKVDHNEAKESPYKITIITSDSRSIKEKVFDINIIDVNVPPTIKTDWQFHSGEETQPLVIPFIGEDFDGDELTYYLISSNVERPEQDLNNHFGPVVTKKGNLVWTPGYEHGGNTYTATVMVEDGRGGEAKTTIQIEVTDRPVKPTIKFLNGKDYAVKAGKEVKVRLDVFDQDNNLMGTYAKHKDSKGNYVEDAISKKYSHENREFVWTPTSTDVGTHYIKFFAYDNENSVSDEVKIIVSKETGTPADPDPTDPLTKNTYEKKYDEYKEDFDDLEDDYYFYKKKYEVAVFDKDQSDKNKYKKKLDKVDDDLKDLKDDIKDLIDDVEEKDKDNDDLLDDLEELKDDLNSLRDKISNISGKSSTSTSSGNILSTKFPATNKDKATSNNVEIQKMDFSHLVNTATVQDTVAESGFSNKMYLLIAGIVILVIAIIFLLAILLL